MPRCTCPIVPFRDDPYYHCDYCARLIAAAPDLYEALKQLHDAADEALSFIDEMRERGDFDHWQSFSLGDLGAAIHNARTALSKASQQQGSPQAPVAQDSEAISNG